MFWDEQRWASALWVLWGLPMCPGGLCQQWSMHGQQLHGHWRRLQPCWSGAWLWSTVAQDSLARTRTLISTSRSTDNTDSTSRSMGKAGAFYQFRSLTNEDETVQELILHVTLTSILDNICLICLSWRILTCFADVHCKFSLYEAVQFEISREANRIRCHFSADYTRPRKVWMSGFSMARLVISDDFRLLLYLHVCSLQLVTWRHTASDPCYLARLAHWGRYPTRIFSNDSCWGHLRDPCWLVMSPLQSIKFHMAGWLTPIIINQYHPLPLLIIGNTMLNHYQPSTKTHPQSASHIINQTQFTILNIPNPPLPTIIKWLNISQSAILNH